MANKILLFFGKLVADVYFEDKIKGFTDYAKNLINRIKLRRAFEKFCLDSRWTDLVENQGFSEGWDFFAVNEELKKYIVEESYKIIQIIDIELKERRISEINNKFFEVANINNPSKAKELKQFLDAVYKMILDFWFETMDSESKLAAGIAVDKSQANMKKIEDKRTEDMNIIEKDLKEIKLASQTTLDYVKNTHSNNSQIIDEKINEDIEIIRKSRFYNEFDIEQESLELAQNLIEWELSNGSKDTRCRAIAWCSRFLSLSDLDKAIGYLEHAKTLGQCQEIAIAEAFISSQKGNKQNALGILHKLNTPSSRTASVMIINNHNGGSATVDWLNTVGMSMLDLDSDGKYFLMNLHLQLEQWDDAFRCLEAITDDDLQQTPAIYQILGVTHLIRTVPTDLRTAVLNKVPLSAAKFPLAADSPSIEDRRKAARFFHTAAEVANKMCCSESAKIYDEYEIWLELMDSNQAEQALERLKDKLRDTKGALNLVGLALEFGVNLDLGLVEHEIERQIAFHGGVTRDVAMARYAIVFAQKTPKDVAQYFVKNKEGLTKCFNKRYLQFLEIDMLSQAGMIDKAKECLATLAKDGLSEDEENRLKSIISRDEGLEPAEEFRKRFKNTDSLQDLVLLVNELQVRNEWEALSEYSEFLFARTHSMADAERLIEALNRTQSYKRIVELLTENSHLLDQSRKLHRLFCWALYFEGALLESRAELKKIYNPDDANLRELLINVGIVSGDWNSLTAYIANEYVLKEKRNARELIHDAQLAYYVASPYAKEFTLLAAEKGKEDPHVLFHAYNLATSAGWEDCERVSQWLNIASRYSDSNGPIQIKSLQDIIDMKPDWDRRETETMQLLNRGDIPMFLAGDSLNMSLIHMMLFPALANLTKSDPRKKGLIPTYSGKRKLLSLTIPRSIAIDTTALISLSFLKLLDKALDLFETVYIPHSTLKWLFEEKQKAAFHQPSRIRNAHQLQQLLAKDTLEKFIPNSIPDSDLSEQIGDELAALIAEAKKGYDNNTQCLVVRPYPVHRIGSLLMEEADLTQYANILCSCQSIVDMLRSKGQITVEEAKKAYDYLQIVEKPWPNQPIISENAVLYFDGLAITYLQHLGLLEKIKAAGVRSIVSPRELSESNELTSYECISVQITDAIEQIRSSLISRIDSGKIKIGRVQKRDELAEKSALIHISTELIALAKECEAILTDDRFLNQYENTSEGGKQAHIFSTIDLLEMLAVSVTISTNELYNFRTLLRRAGYIFVPINDPELVQYINAAIVKDERIIETTELKAIRENILSIRMSNWLQLPKESPWLAELFNMFIRVLRSIWTNETDFQNIRARSKWILDQIDIRGWAHCFEMSVEGNIFHSSQIDNIVLLYQPLINAPRENNVEYFKWIEEMIIAPIKTEFSDMYFEIVERYRKYFEAILEKDLPQSGLYDKISDIMELKVQVAVELLPPLIRESLFEDAKFIEKYELAIEPVISFVTFGLSFNRSEFFNAIRECLSGVPKINLLDKHDNECELFSTYDDGKLPIIELSCSDHRFNLPDFSMVALDSTMRLHYLELNAVNVNLPYIETKKWQDILSQRSLNDDEVDAFYHEYNQTPVEQAKSIRSKIMESHIDIASLVPTSQKYFERLIGVYDGSISISDYAVGGGKEFLKQLSSWNPYEGFLLSLYLSSHSALTSEINVNQLDSEDIVSAFEFIEKSGDRISQLGAIEVGLRVISLKPEVEPIIIRLIEQLRDDDGEAEDSKINLLASLFILVDGELSRIHLFSKMPPFYRRLAALSQAALICRQIENSNIDIGQFILIAFNARFEQYYYQTLTDMREEPCWNPDLAAASQFRADFLGRIAITANKYKKSLKNGKLYNLIFGTNLSALCEIPNSFFPGPLEGAVETLNILPEAISKAIELQLQAEEVSPKSFFALVNSAMIFRIGTDKAELATKALKFGSHRLANIEDRSQLLSILNGLANVAAITRSRALADELRILVRIYRRDQQYALSVDEVMRICLVAASSRKDLIEWRDFTGEWLTELAFCDFGDNDGHVFHSHLNCLCHAVPELWVTCGRADAASVAYIAQTC